MKRPRASQALAAGLAAEAVRGACGLISLLDPYEARWVRDELYRLASGLERRSRRLRQRGRARRT